MRLIQEKEIKPLGSSVSKSVDVRIIASTNRDLEAKIIEKSFREDLFYRLNVVTIFMPPLREIPEDIPVLAQRFVHEASEEFNISPKSISEDVMKHLMSQAWPGNIRQLKNSLQKAMIFSKGDTLELKDFIHRKSARRTAETIGSPSPDRTFRAARDRLIDDFTRKYLSEALTRHGGNISAAARESGLERQHFQKLMRKAGMTADNFRPDRS